MHEPSDRTSGETTMELREIMGSGSKTAIAALLNRFGESLKPVGERICYDPYAVYFIDKKLMDWALHNPDKVIAMRDENERINPGFVNSIIARVRYFDDFTQRSLERGIEQLVILGAGYDTRAYRIEGLKRIRIFEVDHPSTQDIKITKLKNLFGALPSNVVYISADLISEDIFQKLMGKGYDPSKKTLFLMEGLLYYLPPSAVERMLSSIMKNSAKGSVILFDYLFKSVVDGSTPLEAGRNLKKGLAESGEPLKFGIEDGKIEEFLANRGFSQIANATGREYKEAYFQGENKDRIVSELLSFAHALIE
ncbi:MAG: class I SAM-dependent methyltransferase [Methanothrix sp.]|nr:class I SAM-dependent methyltransferase [Methanothrix sp.]MDD4446778.1 class I SAM-dependent methyltransferase [Methanothrix sp.]